jgi:hypothetical protein
MAANLASIVDIYLKDTELSYDLAALLVTDLAWHSVQAQTGSCRDTARGMIHFVAMDHTS